MNSNETLSYSNGSIVQNNKVLKNTYMLLSATLLFSSLTAWLGVSMGFKGFGPLITLVGYFALLFITHKTKDSMAGLFSVFALTGFLGLTLAPLLKVVPSGIIVQSLFATGALFFGLSFYTLKNQHKNFNKYIGVASIAILVSFGLSLLNVFWLHMPILSLVISLVFAVLSSYFIMAQTDNIVKGGETNYILATVTLYVSMYNIFTFFLQLFGIMDRD